MHRFPLPARAFAAATGLSLAIAAPTLAHGDHGKTMTTPPATTKSAKAKAKTQKVDIAFAAVAGDQPVRCNAPITGLGTTSQTAQLRDLRFYVSGVRLVKASGFEVPVTLTPSAFQVTRPGGAVALIDLEDGKGACAEDGTPAVNASVRGTVPAGRYTGVRWTVGVPFALNHTDLAAAPAPLNSTALGWSWQVGRKFTKIEVSDPAGGAWQTGTFFVHVGSVGCTGNPATGRAARCTTPNRANIRLRSFDPARQRIAVDVRSLLAGNDITVNRANSPGCMSGPTDPECMGVFRSLGIAWRADGKGSGRSPVSKQTVFRTLGR